MALKPATSSLRVSSALRPTPVSFATKDKSKLFLSSRILLICPLALTSPQDWIASCKGFKYMTRVLIFSISVTCKAYSNYGDPMLPNNRTLVASSRTIV